MELEVVRHLARSALQNLEAHRRRIDDLNVTPCPTATPARTSS